MFLIAEKTTMYGKSQIPMAQSEPIETLFFFETTEFKISVLALAGVAQMIER